MHLSAAEAISRCKSINPTDQVIGIRDALLKDCEHMVDVLGVYGVNEKFARIHTLHLHDNPRDHTK